MKKIFEEPWLEILNIHFNEIIATSSGEDGMDVNNPDFVEGDM